MKKEGKKMNILITGGSGFVGINLTEEFLKHKATVVNYDPLPVMEEALNVFRGMEGTYFWEKGDVLDGSHVCAVLRKYKIDMIIHTAVITPNEERERRDMRRIFEINCSGTIELLRGAAACGLKRFIYVSSIAIYGETAHTMGRLTEEMRDLTPKNLYEISKFASEALALRCKQLYGLEVTAVRLGDVFGPWERPTGVRDIMSAPYQTFKMAREGTEAILPRANRTSWVYSREVAKAIYAIAGQDHLPWDIFNISSGSVWSIEDWCWRLKQEYQDFRFQIAPSQANVRYHADLDNGVMDVTRLIQGAGYLPCYGLEESFADYKQWADEFGYLMD